VAIAENWESVNVVEREYVGSVQSRRSVFSLVPVVAVLRSIRAIGTVVGQILGIRVSAADLTGVSELLGNAGLQRVIVGIKSCFQSIDIVPAYIGAHGVDVGIVGRGEDGIAVRGMQTGSERRSGTSLIDVHNAEQVGAL